MYLYSIFNNFVYKNTMLHKTMKMIVICANIFQMQINFVPYFLFYVVLKIKIIIILKQRKIKIIVKYKFLKLFGYIFF